MKKILIFPGLVLLIAASVWYYVFIYSATHRRDISEEKAISITAVALVANYNENGFAVVRILGNDMNPNNIINMISVLQSANIDMEQLKPLQGLLK